jgi:hypothetical protein
VSPALLTSLLLLATPGGLLPSATLVREDGVSRTKVITDGTAPRDGDGWDTPLTAILAPRAVLEYDLGEPKHVAAVLLSGDNNDDYILEGSLDGSAWFTLWRAPPDPIPGMRTRTIKTLDASTRYVKLTAERGDNSYSVGELQLFSTPEELTGDTVIRPPPPPKPEAHLDTGLVLVLGLGGLMAYFLTSDRRPKPPPAAKA